MVSIFARASALTLSLLYPPSLSIAAWNSECEMKPSPSESKLRKRAIESRWRAAHCRLTVSRSWRAQSGGTRGPPAPLPAVARYCTCGRSGRG